MFKYDFTLVLRYFWKRKIYSFIILMSLVVGFTFANLLISFLISETNTDSSHLNNDRIYQMFSKDPFNDNGTIAYIPKYLYDYLDSSYPEIESICQIGGVDGAVIETKSGSFQDQIIISADSSLFTFFSFELFRKTGGTILGEQNIAISKEKAIAYFGSTDVIGQIITLKTPDTVKQLMVSAVFDKPAENSHLVFDAVVHHAVQESKWQGGPSYILIGEKNDAQNLQNEINADPQRPGLMGSGNLDYFFKPLTNSYFNPDNKMVYMKTRSMVFIKIGYLVCGLILFMAGFNFVNLFLLSWQNRKKEIGIKKTLGISVKSLFAFSIVEVGVYVLLAFALALLFTAGLLPLFNQVVDANLSLGYFLNLRVLSFIGLMVLLSGAAIVLVSVWSQWRMRPISLMSQLSTKVVFSKLLFTIQFTVAIALVICSTTIIWQMDYMESAPLGFNRNIIQVEAPSKKEYSNLFALKQKVLQLAGVNHATVFNGNPISGNMMIRYELENDKFYTPYLFAGDNDLIETLNLKLIEGKVPTGSNNEKLVNQKLVKQFNLVNPVGAKIPGTTNDIIAGVVQDFTCGSFKMEIPPVIITIYNEANGLLIDYSGQNIAELLPLIQKEWTRIYPDHYFSYTIIQEELMKKYKEETSFYKVIVTFSITCMILSCFGLFALSWAVIQSRTKEIGIRKVLGASPADVLNLITITFTKRILLAFLIATPIGYYLMNLWLERFANKITINIWIWVIAAVVVLVVALVTLSMQTVKAAVTNPVDEIRYE